MQAAIYCRISSDRTGEKAGVTRQEEDCRALIEREGWSVAGVYTDNDLSAYNGKTRPGYERMLGGLAAGHVQAVVAWHPDRLHRSPRELEDFIDAVERAGAKVRTVTAGEYDLSTPSGRMTARIVGSVARHESEHKAERIRRALEEVAREGRVGSGGWRPFGYDDDRVTVREAEADLIREAAGRVLRGESIRGIVRDWEARGIKAPAGGPWMTHTLKRVLVNPRVAGLRAHHGEVVGEAVWQSIIDREMWERLCGTLNGSQRRFRARSYLLSGMARCALCGAVLASKRSDRKARQYWCSPGPERGGCGRQGINAEDMERMVAEAVFAALDGRGLAEARRRYAGTDHEQQRAAERLAADEAKLANLARDFAEDRITRVEWMAAREVMEGRLEQHRRTLRTNEVTAVLADLDNGRALRRAWEERALDWRRALVSAVVHRVIVHPQRGCSEGCSWCAQRALDTPPGRFDPERVEPRWRA